MRRARPTHEHQAVGQSAAIISRALDALARAGHPAAPIAHTTDRLHAAAGQLEILELHDGWTVPALDHVQAMLRRLEEESEPGTGLDADAV